VTLVGAGPGDPELLTLKAIRALQSADIILYDDLVSPACSNSPAARPSACWSARPAMAPPSSRSDINALIVSLASQGKHVVRLKGGDPGIFGRAGEEIDCLKRPPIPVAIVPGISAAQGCGGLAWPVPDPSRPCAPPAIRHRPRPQRRPAGRSRLEAMADPHATTVIYMARATLAGFRDRAVAAGLDPQTPAIAVLAATRPDEARVAATIATLAGSAGRASGRRAGARHGRACLGAPCPKSPRRRSSVGPESAQRRRPVICVRHIATNMVSAAGERRARRRVFSRGGKFGTGALCAAVEASAENSVRFVCYSEHAGL
jgi:siroheme synthase